MIHECFNCRGHVFTHLGICLNFEPAIAQVAFASEREYRGRVVRSDFLLLSVVSNAHSNVVVACTTKLTMRHSI